MNALDVVLVVAALASALAGFRHGFVVAFSSLVGFLAGAWLGLQVTPLVLGAAPRVFTTAMFALVIVLVLAWGGQVLGTAIGRRIRARIAWRPGRLVDSGAGAVTGVAYVLVLAWALGVALAGSGLALSSPVRGSVVLGAVDRALPASSASLFPSFTRLLDRTGFPTVFAPFTNERIAPIDPPALSESVTSDVLAAAESVVRVYGPACRDAVTGSGFVYAPGFVVTNAHVVAGMTEPRVADVEGQSYAATVVGFDPSVDVAVLSVPGLKASALPYGGSAQADDPVAVLGYPGGGAFQAVPGRIRAERSIVGPDIYERTRVVREAYSLRAEVRPGNSGGPLLRPDGTVLGIVFAASLDDAETGYALTAAEARPVIEAAVRAHEQTSVGRCL